MKQYWLVPIIILYTFIVWKIGFNEGYTQACRNYDLVSDLYTGDTIFLKHVSIHGKLY